VSSLLVPLLVNLRDSTLNKLALLDATSALRWATANRDPRRYPFFADLLLPSASASLAFFVLRCHSTYLHF
jgi:hypothetical protein